MGVGDCYSKPSYLNWRNSRRDILKFFQAASESDIILRYPCFGETLAHNIVLKRENASLKSFRDIWDLSAVRRQLLREYALPVDDVIDPPDLVIYESQVPQIASAPPLPKMMPADEILLQLVEALTSMGVVERWRDYVSKWSTISVRDALPANMYRLATWNLDRFTLAKARHPGVREAICLTLLSNQIDLVAFQEVVEPEAVEMLVKELNQPVLPMVRRWFDVNRSRRGRYEAFSSSKRTGRTFQGVEYSSFLYRADRLKALSARALTPSKDESRAFSRLPFMGKFKLGSCTLVLASVHLKAPGLRDTGSKQNTEEISGLADFVDALNETFSGKHYYVILGDFNLNPNDDAFDALRSHGLANALPSTCPTMASAVERERRRGQREPSASCLDNAWLCPDLVRRGKEAGGLWFTGSCAVAKPLRHPLVPSVDFSDAGGPPSDHCPVYFDLTLTSAPN